VHHAEQVIDGHEQPARAVRRKRASSLVVGMQLVAAGAGDAFVSAGNTGAIMVGGLLELGRLPGVERAALGTVIPTTDGRGTLLLDMGATMDATAIQLMQFAIMGSAYMELARGLSAPRVGLLNVGSEESKGNEVVKQAYRLLQSCDLNFVGNIEGRDIILGGADVVLCDGFVGNVVLKHTEGLGKGLFEMMKEEFTRDLRGKLGAFLLRPALRNVLARMDYSEYGGAPLLGVKGVCIKCHGSSRARAVKNGIVVAERLAAMELPNKIAAQMAGIKSERDG
jgi:glycerol-3-phosphate acyltransferase PlsX